MTNRPHTFYLHSRYRYHNWPYYETVETVPPLDKPANYYGDIDLVAILPILVSGCVMLTPILNWSQIVRKHKAQAVVIWWGVLMYAALIPVLIVGWWGVDPYYVSTQISTCSNQPPNCNYEVIQYNDFESKDFFERSGALFLRDQNRLSIAHVDATVMTRMAWCRSITYRSERAQRRRSFLSLIQHIT